MVEVGFPRRLIIGEPAADALAGLLEYYGVGRVLVVTDRGLVAAGVVPRLVDELKSRGFDVGVFDGVEPEPPVGVGGLVAEEARRRGAQAIVAVGGGSVIDAAKAGLAVLAGAGDLEGVAPFQPLGAEGLGVLLVAVPTTAGTGSDASYAMVLTRVEPGGRRVKVAVANYELVPHASILDPDLPAGAPRRVAVGAAVDALTHAVEALVAAQSNPVTDALAEHAARLVFTSLPSALGGDREAWLRLHAAASMAGIAFSSAGLGLAHALGHPLGAALRLHHGTTVGILLPHVLDLYYEKAPAARGKLERLRRILEAVEGQPPRPTLADHVLALYQAVGQPSSLAEAGVDRGSFDSVKEWVAEEALHDPDIAFAPYTPDPGELLELLEKAYTGRPPR